ncbi:hypothetical protein D9M68_797250 [compost metagenome]
MGHEHGRFGDQLAGFENAEHAFIAIVAVAHDFGLSAFDQQIVESLVAFSEQDLPRFGAQGAGAAQQAGNHFRKQSRRQVLQQRVPGQQGCRGWPGQIDICHSGSFNVNGRILNDNNSYLKFNE